MPENELKILWNNAWKLLAEAADNPKKSFGTPVVATVSEIGIPRSRTLVLRNAAQATGEVWCYTDRRSVKARHLATGQKVMAWTFWAPEEQLQFNCHGPTTWLPDEQARQVFISLPKHSRKAYATLAPPGSPQAAPTDGLPAAWPKLTVEETADVGRHFGILCTRITRAEVLQLSRAGHRRMVAERSQGEDWQMAWLVP